jgi:hypothetical protein
MPTSTCSPATAQSPAFEVLSELASLHGKVLPITLMWRSERRSQHGFHEIEKYWGGIELRQPLCAEKAIKVRNVREQ